MTRSLHAHALPRLMLLILLPTGSSFAGGASEFWLGSGANCNFGSLTTAIGAVPDGAVINIANNQSYENINAVINNKSLTLIGGWADCTGKPDDQPTRLAGNAGLGQPVLLVTSGGTPREVALRNLHITDGSRSGIELGGTVSLTIHDSRIDDNVGNTGGAIHVQGVSHADTRLWLIDSIIGEPGGEPGSGNLALMNGGGIACSNARIWLGASVIHGNRADGLGGGLHLHDCRVSTLMSRREYPGLGWVHLSIAGNEADAFGGGMSVTGSSQVQLGYGLLDDESAIRNNVARWGGGIYAVDFDTEIVIEGLSLSGNRASDQGGAVSLQTGAALVMGRSILPPPILLEHRGIVVPVLPSRCRPGVICNEVVGNRVDNFTGSAFWVGQATFDLRQTRVADNWSANGGAIVLSESDSRIESSLIEGNICELGELIRIIQSHVNLVGNTIVGNVNSPTLIRTFAATPANIVNLHNNIIWQPGTTILASQEDDDVNAVCNNSHETASIPGLDHDPDFLDPDNGDYRLHASSANVDACTGNPFPETTRPDLLGHTRPIQLPGLGAGAGRHDRGAMELPREILRSHFGYPFGNDE